MSLGLPPLRFLRLNKLDQRAAKFRASQRPDGGMHPCVAGPTGQGHSLDHHPACGGEANGICARVALAPAALKQALLGKPTGHLGDSRRGEINSPV
jgi:hypothetical protein